MIKNLLGIAPKQAQEGGYTPSPVALKMATSSTTNYTEKEFTTDQSNSPGRILMVCTQEKYMTMANGKKFSTGNHPVEMLVPMLHLVQAGFEIDLYTTTGKPVKIEQWAMPKKDREVMALYEEYEEDFKKPKSLSKFVSAGMQEENEYKAVFIPGGHGAMLGLPDSKPLQKLLRWAHEKGLYTMAICHGPAALLAENLDGSPEEFLYNGYSMAAFPDSMDKKTPLFGYMPGHMPWYFGEKLENLGVTIVNSKADNTCHVDRKLITGASPEAANDFGILAARELLKVNS